MRNYEPNADRVVALYQQLEDDIITASFPPVFSLGSGNLCRKTESPERLLQSARDFLLKKRIKMKQTVSCKYQDTLELLRNEGANVT